MATNVRDRDYRLRNKKLPPLTAKIRHVQGAGIFRVICKVESCNAIVGLITDGVFVPRDKNGRDLKPIPLVDVAGRIWCNRCGRRHDLPPANEWIKETARAVR